MKYLPQALVDHQLEDIIDQQLVSDYDLRSKEYLQPASIDLPIGNRAYRVDRAFLPFKHNIRDLVEEHTIRDFDLTDGTELHKGQTYLIPLLDVDLDKNHSARLSPKSSIGRIDLMVRAITDQLGQYDTISAGAKGEVWLEVRPQSFNVDIKAGQKLNQLRVFDETTTSMCHIDPQEVLPGSYDKYSNLLVGPNKLTLSLDVPQGLVGYRARDTSKPIDLSKVAAHDWQDFFEPVHGRDGFVSLEKDRFYILATRERTRIDPQYSVEMIATDTNIGELRAHYAGFFDPGFGMPDGARAVLEIRPHENMDVYHGQQICSLEFFRNSAQPRVKYGESGSNYQGQQGPRLAKFMKQPDREA